MDIRISCLLLLVFLCARQAHGQEIAITFDDAPTFDTPLFSHAERAEKIRRHLGTFGAKSAFFVITGNITPANSDQLKAYTQQGHVLANHSHSHYSPGRVPVDTYLADIRTADSLLRHWKDVMPWYRYPFLNEGTTIPKRDSIRATLVSLGLSNGYVTVDNYDWFINGQLVKALRENRSVNWDALKQIYLDHIWTSISFYDSVARNTLGRSPRHVLLLHENDLAALYLGDLLKLLSEKGWKIISPATAYEDEIADVVPDVLFNGQGRIGAIAYSRGTPARDLVQESEDEAYLEALLIRKKVFE